MQEFRDRHDCIERWLHKCFEDCAIETNRTKSINKCLPMPMRLPKTYSMLLT